MLVLKLIEKSRILRPLSTDTKHLQITTVSSISFM